MLTINDLKNKLIVIIDEVPYQILEVKHLHMGRGGSSVQTKIKNLVTAQVFLRNFKSADSFREADIAKRELLFLYHHRGEFFFATRETPSQRFSLPAEKLSDSAQWLKPKVVVTALFLENKLLSVELPIKIDLQVTEAPPGLKGDTATAATKTVVVETGAKVQTPLFVNEGDTVRVNTETGEYVERVVKAR